MNRRNRRNRTASLRDATAETFLQRRVSAVPAVSAFLCLTAAASAQTAPSILIEPWPGDVLAQTVDDLQVHAQTDVEQDDSDATLFVWDSAGRVKLDRADTDPKFVVGYRFLNLDVNADRADLHGTYNDLAIVGGFQLGAWSDWKVAALVGAGSTNDGHWDEGDAAYGLGAVNLSRSLGEGETLHLGVSYDGNRATLPDVPLPYVSYVNTRHAQLTYVIGLPASSVTWRPAEAWELALRYTAPLDLRADASYRLTPRLSLFAAYDQKTDAFVEHDETRDHQRLFYRRSDATAGLRYEHKLADVSLGLGYAFDQEFSRGWDARDTDGFADLEDGAFLMLMIRGTF